MVSIAEQLADLPSLMADASVPGVSVAYLPNPRTRESAAFGVIRAGTEKPVTPETVFQAASISKPVFARIVLALVADGVLDLDGPLREYGAEPFVTDGALLE